MAEEIRFPRLGWSMEEGRFVRWLREPGDLISEGDPLFEMEGEKAIQEIESVGAGTLFLSAQSPEPDSMIGVGTLLGFLLAPGESAPESLDSSPSQTAVSQQEHDRAVLAIESEEDQQRDFARTATPRARRLAKAEGIDWERMEGTGRGGRVRETDVRAVLMTNQPPPAAIPSDPSRRLFGSRRKVIADRLRRSWSTTLPVTLHTSADVSSLVAFRERQKGLQAEFVPAYTDLFAKMVATVLANHPLMAVRWNEDHTDLVPVNNESIAIGIAVDTPDGLLVPVLRNVANEPIEKIVQRSRELIQNARSGRLTRHEMTDGTFTITNLGAYGIDTFTPIINSPEIAILGLGAIRRVPEFSHGDQVVARLRMALSLTFDHAAVDGAPAAAFLKDLVSLIESNRLGPGISAG